MPWIDVQPRQRVALPELLLLLLRRVDNRRRNHQSLNALCRIPDGRHDRWSSAITVRADSLVEQRNGGRLNEWWRLVIGRDLDAGEPRVAVLRERLIGRFLTSRHVGVVSVLEDADQILQVDVLRGRFAVAILLLLVFGNVHADWRRRKAANSRFDRFRKLDDLDLFGFRFEFLFQISNFSRSGIVKEIFGFFGRS